MADSKQYSQNKYVRAGNIICSLILSAPWYKVVHTYADSGVSFKKLGALHKK